ncbi:export protein FliQ family 3 [Thermovirga lienii DSM 17291]|jgi:flagellar biosynthetic protein FliQ|uniref:Export protein FliQ family 3 n=1 Tax=Thermovirga lienii (strain ATCC BAA-1197 / DSM 17291 / Cas60314) TaxID=580340 RepID=G7V5U2_THELD|nr:flagellar biosynthetic protein FliQ [Thermovirga lienii]AER65847.1 export protein FliQ family 3 [Thermovirga lienii DSM 17291]MDN5368137.1 flagellar biosynthesis protein FliQ [Thermovirga sp.]HCD72442.1 flagellar biosynthetic protein FliQ [Thermovirga lienii]
MDGSLGSLFSSALWTAIGGVLPILLAATLVGLAMGILQTATSIQEQTLSFLPKILVVLFVSLFWGTTLFSPLLKLASDIFGNLESFIK